MSVANLLQRQRAWLLLQKTQTHGYWVHTCLCQEEEKTAGCRRTRPALSQSVFGSGCLLKGTDGKLLEWITWSKDIKQL